LDKKGKKIVRCQRSKVYAKDRDSEEKARQRSQERKVTNSFRRMLGIGKAGGPDSYQGTPSTTYGSLDDDRFLRDESMQWELMRMHHS
ncbi:hypothetical protein PIB30_095054, partial [Stylosanthes scabra]|nr:hypothetical protein [Stylosanthes scabra]